MDLKLVGQKIKESRTARNLTQEELGELTDLTSSYVSVIERGVKVPTLGTFIKIANALNVSADSLLVDVLNTSMKITASKLSDQIEKLPIREQKKILEVVRVLAEFDKDE